MPDIEDKLKFLQSPKSYGDGNQLLQCIETHMSWVFLLESLVFKLKKPVYLPFLDFSTLEAREFYCREEVRLNARMAPGIYLGVVALQWCGESFARIPDAQLPAPGQTVDWLVQMRRLPSQRMLLQRIKNKLGDITQRDRIKRFGLPVFAGIGQIGNDGGHPRCAVLAQGGDEHHEPQQFVMRAVFWITMQAVNHIGICAAWIQQWPEFVFTIFKATYLMCCKRHPQIGRQCLRQLGVSVQRKELHHFSWTNGYLVDDAGNPWRGTCSPENCSTIRQ